MGGVSPASSLATTTATPGERLRMEPTQDRVRGRRPCEELPASFREAGGLGHSLEVQTRAVWTDHSTCSSLGPVSSLGVALEGEPSAHLPSRCFLLQPDHSQGRGVRAKEEALPLVERVRGVPSSDSQSLEPSWSQPEDSNAGGPSGCRACDEEGVMVRQTPGKPQEGSLQEELRGPESYPASSTFWFTVAAQPGHMDGAQRKCMARWHGCPGPGGGKAGGSVGTRHRRQPVLPPSGCGPASCQECWALGARDTESESAGVGLGVGCGRGQQGERD